MLLFALALLYFLYGLSEFLRNQDNEEAQSVGKQHMVWGIIGLFLMFAVFGILNMIENTVRAFVT